MKALIIALLLIPSVAFAEVDVSSYAHPGQFKPITPHYQVYQPPVHNPAPMLTGEDPSTRRQAIL